MKIRGSLIAMAAVALALTIDAQARADTVFQLTTPEGGPIGSLSTSAAVTVDVALLSSTIATVTFTNCTAAGCGTSIGTPAEINVSGAFLASTALPGGFAGGQMTCGGNGFTGANPCGGGDGASFFGTMNVETSGVGEQSFVINLTAEGGNTWASSAAVLTPDSKGFEALVNKGSNGVQDGGFSTPLPAALPLFATGLGGLGLLGWRRKRKAQAVA
jgi:hypothetical protein